jgi:TonB family protein
MKLQDWARNPWRRLVRGDQVPGARVLTLSVLLHCVVLLALNVLVMLQHRSPVIVPVKLEAARKVPAGATYVPPAAKGAPLEIPQKSARRLPRKARPAVTDSTGDGEALQALRAQAKLETGALMQHFRFLGIYGFSPYKYQLPVQTSGELPVISAGQVPPRFEQYVIVEVTIDTDGRVADARITTGDVQAAIQQTLLSAIREFKYRPATRDGIPIPSQLDIVVHVPS